MVVIGEVEGDGFMWIGGFNILKVPSHPFLDGVTSFSYVLDLHRLHSIKYTTFNEVQVID